MSSDWYYSQGGQQIGPVTSQQLKDLAAARQITPADLVWKDGMPEWTPAARVKGLFPDSAGTANPQPVYAANPQTAYSAPQQAYAAPQAGYADQGGGQIGYYSATSDIGARTARILHAIPPVTGSRGEWPLSDHHLAQFAATERNRKPIRGFQIMCMCLMVLYTFTSIVWLIQIIDASRYSYGRRGEAMTYMLLVLLTAVILAVIFPLCGAAAKKCRAWGPIVSIVINSLLALLVVYGLIQIASERYAPTAAILIFLLTLALYVLFIVISVRALTAIPRFLNGPVWCVEAMINARQ